MRIKGGPWTNVPVPGAHCNIKAGFNDAWGSSATDIFVAGNCKDVLHLSGGTWTAQASATYYGISALWGSGPSNVFAVGGYGNIRRYDGSKWSGMSSGTTYTLRGVWGTGPTFALAAGYANNSGIVLRYCGP